MAPGDANDANAESPVFQRLRALIPEDSEPSKDALREISEHVVGLSRAERDAIFQALGDAMRAATRHEPGRPGDGTDDAA